MVLEFSFDGRIMLTHWFPSRIVDHKFHIVHGRHSCGEIVKEATSNLLEGNRLTYRQIRKVGYASCEHAEETSLI